MPHLIFMGMTLLGNSLGLDNDQSMFATSVIYPLLTPTFIGLVWILIQDLLSSRKLRDQALANFFANELDDRSTDWQPWMVPAPVAIPASANNPASNKASKAARFGSEMELCSPLHLVAGVAPRRAS